MWPDDSLKPLKSQGFKSRGSKQETNGAAGSRIKVFVQKRSLTRQRPVWYCVAERRRPANQRADIHTQLQDFASSSVCTVADKRAVTEGSRWFVGNGALWGRKKRLIWGSVPQRSAATAVKYDELTDAVIHLTPGPVDTAEGKRQKWNLPLQPQVLVLFLNLFRCALIQQTHLQDA